MKTMEMKIPPECRKITVKTNERGLEILLEPETIDDYFSKITNHVETLPGANDLSIFWNTGKEREASIGVVSLSDNSGFEGEPRFLSNNMVWYENAIRFRDQSQYISIINYKADETNKDGNRKKT